MISGCSAGTPSPDEPSAAGVDIPTVAKPLEVSAFIDDPCALLDESQRAELGLPVTKTVDLAGVTCELRASEEDQAAVEVEVMPRGGLQSRYDNCMPELNFENCAAWTAGTIGGYPILRANVGDEALTLCRIFLGVSDDRTIEIFDARPIREGRGPNCDTVDRIAVMVLDTLAR